MRDKPDITIGSLIMAIVFGVAVGMIIGGHLRSGNLMSQALDRGYAERCIGTSTIHWKGECPEVAE